MVIISRLKKALHISVIVTLLILGGCSFGDDFPLQLQDVKDEDFSEQAIEDLVSVGHFRDGALEHILEGELNDRGQAVGFHYDGLPTKKGEIIDGTETSLNKFGVYEAEIVVDGVAKTSYGGRSSFFPDEWSAQQVVDAINEAYDDRVLLSGNTYEGMTVDGMVIQMYIDDNGKIISAFPVY